MANVWFDNPPNLVGDEKAQLQQLYTYLYAMRDQLNTALDSLTVDNFAAEDQASLRSAISGNTEQAKKATAGLKELIIKTAEIVRNEMETIQTTLHGEYQAVSEQYGTLTETLEQRIDATARGVMQEFDFQTQIDALDESMSSFSSMNQYIYSGILESGDAGIAIGENIRDDNGDLNTGNMMATFTRKKLSFYENGQEVAYFSNNTMYISKADVAQELTIGSYLFKVLTDNSLALIWKGVTT